MRDLRAPVARGPGTQARWAGASPTAQRGRPACRCWARAGRGFLPPSAPSLGLKLPFSSRQVPGGGPEVLRARARGPHRVSPRAAGNLRPWGWRARQTVQPLGVSEGEAGQGGPSRPRAWRGEIHVTCVTHSTAPKLNKGSIWRPVQSGRWHLQGDCHLACRGGGQAVLISLRGLGPSPPPVLSVGACTSVSGRAAPIPATPPGSARPWPPGEQGGRLGASGGQARHPHSSPTHSPPPHTTLHVPGKPKVYKGRWTLPSRATSSLLGTRNSCGITRLDCRALLPAAQCSPGARKGPFV